MAEATDPLALFEQAALRAVHLVPGPLDEALHLLNYWRTDAEILQTIDLCLRALESSHVPVCFQALCILRDASLQRWAQIDLERRSLIRNTLCIFVFRAAAPMLQRQASSVLAVILKRFWPSEPPEARAQFMSHIALTEDALLGQRLLVWLALVQEFSVLPSQQRRSWMNFALHKGVHEDFETFHLLPLFQATLQILESLFSQNPEEPGRMVECVDLLNSILRWEWTKACTETMHLVPSPSWHDALVAQAQALHTLLFRVHSRACLAESSEWAEVARNIRQCILCLAALSGPVFQTGQFDSAPTYVEQLLRSAVFPLCELLHSLPGHPPLAAEVESFVVDVCSLLHCVIANFHRRIVLQLGNTSLEFLDSLARVTMWVIQKLPPQHDSVESVFDSWMEICTHLIGEAPAHTESEIDQLLRQRVGELFCMYVEHSMSASAPPDSEWLPGGIASNDDCENHGMEDARNAHFQQVCGLGRLLLPACVDCLYRNLQTHLEALFRNPGPDPVGAGRVNTLLVLLSFISTDSLAGEAWVVPIEVAAMTEAWEHDPLHPLYSLALCTMGDCLFNSCQGHAVAPSLNFVWPYLLDFYVRWSGTYLFLVPPYNQSYSCLALVRSYGEDGAYADALLLRLVQTVCAVLGAAASASAGASTGSGTGAGAAGALTSQTVQQKCVELLNRIVTNKNIPARVWSPLCDQIETSLTFPLVSNHVHPSCRVALVHALFIGLPHAAAARWLHTATAWTSQVDAACGLQCLAGVAKAGQNSRQCVDFCLQSLQDSRLVQLLTDALADTSGGGHRGAGPHAQVPLLVLEFFQACADSFVPAMTAEDQPEESLVLVLSQCAEAVRVYIAGQEHSRAVAAHHHHHLGQELKEITALLQIVAVLSRVVRPTSSRDSLPAPVLEPLSALVSNVVCFVAQWTPAGADPDPLAAVRVPEVAKLFYHVLENVFEYHSGSVFSLFHPILLEKLCDILEYGVLDRGMLHVATLALGAMRGAADWFEHNPMSQACEAVVLRFMNFLLKTVFEGEYDRNVFSCLCDTLWTYIVSHPAAFQAASVRDPRLQLLITSDMRFTANHGNRSRFRLHMRHVITQFLEQEEANS